MLHCLTEELTQRDIHMHQPSTFNNVLSPCISSSRKTISSLIPILKASATQQNIQVALTWSMVYCVLSQLDRVSWSWLEYTWDYPGWAEYMSSKQRIQRTLTLKKKSSCWVTITVLCNIFNLWSQHKHSFEGFFNCFWFTECRSVRGCQVTLHWIDGFTLLIRSSDWIICPSTDSSTIRNL